jgi:hypothetical protein
MRKTKWIVLAAVLVLALSAAVVTAYAVSEYKTPAEALAGLTGSTPEAVLEQRAKGDTFGSMAKEARVLDEFKAEMVEIKKAVLEEKVTEGSITREQADDITAAIEERQADCDGTGSGGSGCLSGQAGFGFGFGNGQCEGRNNGRQGMGLGQCGGCRGGN